MHSTAIVLLLMLAANPGLRSGTGSGVHAGGGGRLTTRWIANGVERAASTTNSHLSKVVSFSGAVTSLDWTQTTAGVDGLGGDTFTVAVLLDGVTACSLVVACDAPRGDYTASCEDGSFASGQDLDVRITSTSCLTQPVGFPAIDGTAR